MNAHALAAESVREPEPGRSVDEWLAHCEAVESTTDVLRLVVGREVRRA
jgi:hypothetical protein